jgi:uncharacterized repeat protein (TIGR03803 family)
MGKLGWCKKAYAACLLCATTAIPLPAQTFTTLHSFDSTDGSEPSAALVQATNGNLYGTTVYGGANGDGTVFKITPGGTLTTLYSFCARSGCADGENPYAALVQATDGNFYGTTYRGGAVHVACFGGCGTLFKLTPSGTLTTLYSFCPQSDCTDGSEPSALVQGTDGNLYGTTSYGGANDSGTVFKITPSGTLTTLHSFDGTDGKYPYAALIQATNGNLYGTTPYGGNSGACLRAGYFDGCGTVFKITTSGMLTTLYSFCSQVYCADGQYPFAGLIQATDGNLYGTTGYGGANESCTQGFPFPIGCGTVFRITPSDRLTTLYSFCARSGCADGENPSAALVQATDGNFYGTTSGGGVDHVTCFGGCGTLFKLTPSGTLTTLYSFCSQSGCTDGEGPAALLQDTNGKFYGATEGGGGSSACQGGCGTVFSLSAGLGPFVETEPTSGKVGADVKILGTNLTGATSVTFNGTAATFTLISSSEITTTVPSGATTGKVQVVISYRTLSSNVKFRVAP